MHCLNSKCVFMLTKLTKWTFRGDLYGISKSIVIMAPHTSYWDGIIAKCFLLKLGVRHNFLSKKELFRFPVGLFLRWFGCIPVRGVKGHNAINDICRMMGQNTSLHVVIFPEGGFAPTEQWNPGFYYMAVKANVPIVVAYIDYKQKEVGVKGVIYDTSNIQQVYQEIRELYDGVTAKHPENFKLPKIKGK